MTSKMKTVFLAFLTASFLFSLVSNTQKNLSLKIKHLVNKYGYPFEIHHLETKDGYILELHRIPYSLGNNQSEEQKSVVFLKHGFADNSAAFLIAGPNLSLAYILADGGFDVWMGNHRGNSFSRKHKFYQETNKKFWNFSLHEIGLYDNTAMIDYILAKTNQSKLFHVCHSEGCAEFYAMTSLKPEYNQKIHLSVNLAPGVLFGHPSLLTITAFTPFYILKNVFAYTGHIKVLGRSLLLRALAHIFCRNGSYLQYICIFVIYLIHGFDRFQTNPNYLSEYLEYYPDGASSKQVIHYAGIMFASDNFRQYDYGKRRNINVYNSTLPPKYPLEKVTVPVAIFYGDCDNLVSVKDVLEFSKMIPNILDTKLLKNYNHIGYFLNYNIGKLNQENILRIFQNFVE